MAARYPLFVKRDLDGFFGLAIDNLVQLLLIVHLCGMLCGMNGADEFYIYKHILPGVAVSLLLGNLFYAGQAHLVARRERRSDVTALPYGINTPSLLVYIFFVMQPAYQRTGSAALAWQLGLIACLGSGVIEFVGSFVAERLRRNTPRAALLSTLAGIAITFIAMKFALEIWHRPLVAMVPLAVVLLVYFANARFPLALPGGLVAIVFGALLAWILPGEWTGVGMSADEVRSAWAARGRYLPIWAGNDIWQLLGDPAQRKEVFALLSVIVPMGLFNLIGSLQNIESAEAGGDVFATGPSLAVNGVGTIAAALFGSCFPTTIYIGHPGWKALGARAGYSTLNGIVMTAICLTGTVVLIKSAIPIEAGIAIVMWIGIIITAQAFQTTPQRHAPAVAIGLFPAIAAWGAVIVAGAFMQAQWNSSVNVVLTPGASAATVPATQPDTQPATLATTAPTTQGTVVAQDQPPTLQLAVVTMEQLLHKEEQNRQAGKFTGYFEVNGFLVHAMNVMERGYIFTCMILAAISAFLIDRRFYHAAGWSMVAAVLTLMGLLHAYQVQGNQVDYLLFTSACAPDAFCYRAYPIAIGYALMALLFGLMGYFGTDSIGPSHTDPIEDARVYEE